MNRHRFAKKAAALALCAACLAAPCTPAFAEVEVEPGYDYTRFADDNITLNVYNWGEYISDGADGTMDVVQEFEELTGINVNYTTYDTNESMYAKLKSGGGDYDIIIPSDYMIGQMINEGMLEKLDFSNIPNYALIDETCKNLEYDPTNEYSVPYTWGTVCIVYNTTMVDEGDLSQGWGILWDEQYANNILMFNNSRDAFAIACKMLGRSLNPQSLSDVEDAAQKLKEQKGVVQSYVMDEVFDKMSGGEAALAPYYTGDGMTMMEDNPDLAIFLPAEGTNRFVDAMCILKDAKNVDEAHEWINFIASTESNLANMDYIGYASPNLEALEGYPAYYEETYGEPLDEERYEIMAAPQEVLDRCESYLVLPEATRTLYNDLWIELGL